MSEIFSPADEAFGLVVLLNELKCWEMDWKKQERKKKGETASEEVEVRKLFVNRKSGKKDPWDNLGVKVYKQLVPQIIKRREEEQSKKWEAAYKDSHGPTTCDADDLNNNQANEPLVAMEVCTYEQEHFMSQLTFMKTEDNELTGVKTTLV